MATPPRRAEIETAIKAPSLDVLERLTRALMVPLADLLE